MRDGESRRQLFDVEHSRRSDRLLSKDQPTRQSHDEHQSKQDAFDKSPSKEGLDEGRSETSDTMSTTSNDQTPVQSMNEVK